MAEALLNEFGGSDFAAFSAETEPRPVRPETKTVLGEIGIDWSGALSKSVVPFVGQPFDYVITVCDRARLSCPVFPGELLAVRCPSRRSGFVVTRSPR
jgi:arsenate reductase